MAGDLMTADQARDIETLIHRVGVDPDAGSVTMATMMVGGSSAPYGYLLLSRSQALALIMLLMRYVRHREREAIRLDEAVV